ncbi:class I SAM-dependent rRNA methyltransferase [Alloprevotella rava]|uniref:23S rRNA (Cytosine1962-C5)-methyltransferase n=1 Tax=Alloprevotella rava TaxID=671218 RepID=A0A7W5UIA2_9BACT|nr:class I SAM-dependent rRNA methyltransferase [Alloprevotella rava]MBB3703021.1 23S rRNA (cytosine1962-C5)-methyltransferase [Alloprevotella rava]
MYPTIQLRRGKAESLKRFHPWIFSGAIQKMPENLTEGQLVRVVDHEGTFLAIGHYQIGSIAIRVLSFVERNINKEFWKERLSEAFKMRCSIGLLERENNNTLRLIHGEGDQLPGLIIDLYGKTAVMQAHSVGMHLYRKEIAAALIEVCKETIENVYYKSETTLPFKADLHEKDGFLIGGNEDNIAVEYGLKFHIDWLRGQKTGFFIDQRENRKLLEQYSMGKNVLNMFCYTGGFSVYALRGEATRVTSVDSSAKAIDLTRANAELNFPGDSRHDAFAEDAFKFLEKAGNDYELIVLDPPAFAKHKGALRNALKGYTRLNTIAISKIRKGGIIFTFSCSQAVNKDQFRLAVFTAAAQAGRHVRILHQLHQPADHPINIYHPEGEYLKGLVLEVE